MIGQTLIFGILSLVLVATLIGFNVAKESATERSIDVRAGSVAQAAAFRINEAALFARDHGPGDDVNVTYSFAWDLASDIEGHGFTLDVEPDRVLVQLNGADAEGIAPLSARLETFDDVEVCNTDPLSGGPLELIMMTITPSNEDAVDPSCTTGVHGHRVIFFQESQ